MSPLLVFLVGCVPSFAAGALARPYIDRLLEEAHMPATPMPRRRWHINPVLILMTFTTVIACTALIYTVTAKDESDKRLAALANCVAVWSRESSGTTLARAEAAKNRDAANVAATKAMREWAKRILAGEELQNSQPIRQAAGQYIFQSSKYINESKAFDDVRKDEPVLLFNDAYCGKVSADRKAER